MELQPPAPTRVIGARVVTTGSPTRIPGQEAEAGGLENGVEHLASEREQTLRIRFPARSPAGLNHLRKTPYTNACLAPEGVECSSSVASSSVSSDPSSSASASGE